MKTPDTKKKAWVKPEVQVLSISKDTFSGSVPGAEDAKAYGPPYK